VDGFGEPHVHSGLGSANRAASSSNAATTAICDLSLKTEARSFFVSFLGNHDEIRALLRRGSYR
jgi:hypothetical protein